MTDPVVLLGLALVASLNFYVMLGGADYGGGVWDLLATDQRQSGSARPLLARSVPSGKPTTSGSS